MLFHTTDKTIHTLGCSNEYRGLTASSADECILLPREMDCDVKGWSVQRMVWSDDTSCLYLTTDRWAMSAFLNVMCLVSQSDLQRSASKNYGSTMRRASTIRQRGNVWSQRFLTDEAHHLSKMKHLKTPSLYCPMYTPFIRVFMPCSSICAHDDVFKVGVRGIETSVRPLLP